MLENKGDIVKVLQSQVLLWWLGWKNWFGLWNFNLRMCWYNRNYRRCWLVHERWLTLM